MNLHTYITGGGLKNDVENSIKQYEKMTFIDVFMRRSEPKWFYEATVQGFIYFGLARNFDIALNKDHLIFLEQPYSPISEDNRADIMLVSRKSEEIMAIEIKNDFKYGSILQDLYVLASYIKDGAIARGYGIFFAENANKIDAYISDFKKDKYIKPYLNKTLFAVGIIGTPK